MRTYKRPLHEKHDDLYYALPRERDRMSVLTYADLQGTTMRAMSSRELKGTNLGGQFQGSLGHKLWDHEDSSRSSVMLCSLEL